MDKKDARDLIKYHLANKSILHPDEVRELYESAGYPTPPHLIKEVLTEEEVKHRAEIAKKLFGKSVIEDLIPMQLNGTPEDVLRGYLKVYWDNARSAIESNE